MECLKCGRSIDPGQVFCESGLNGMEQHPVRPGTPITLPRRTAAPSKKAQSRRRAMTQEELTVIQRKTIKRLWVALLCTLLCLAVSVVLLLHFASNQEIHNNIGQNYNTRSVT